MKNTKLTLNMKKTAKENKMYTPGERSLYARKKEFCDKMGCWGFEFALKDKPWK